MVSVLKKIEIFILAAGIIICAVSASSRAFDPVLGIRHLIFGVLAAVLFLLITFRAMIAPESVDFSVLRRWIFPVFAGFLVVSVISLWRAVNVTEGLYEVLKIFTMMVFLFEVVVIGDRKFIFKALCLLGLWLAVYGLWEFRVHNPLSCPGTMGAKNQWAAALLLMIPFCLQTTRYGRVWKVIGIIASILLTINICWLQTRSVYLGLALSVCVVMRKRLVLTIVGIVITVAVLWCVHGSRIFCTGSLYHRQKIWSPTLRMIADNPIGGIGIGNWRIVIASYGIKYAKSFTSLFYRQPHNDFFGVTAETGVFGLLFYLGIFVLAFYYGRGNPFILMALTAYTTFAFFSFPRERLFASVIFVYFLGWAILNHHTKTSFVMPRQYLYLVSLLVFGVLFMSIHVFYRRYVVDCSARFIRQNKGNWRLIANEKYKYSPLATLDPITAPVYLHFGIAEHRLGNKREALRCFEKAVADNPYHVYALNNYAASLACYGQLTMAMEYLDRAWHICPELEVTEHNIQAILRSKKL